MEGDCAERPEHFCGQIAEIFVARMTQRKKAASIGFLMRWAVEMMRSNVSRSTAGTWLGSM